LPPHAEFVAGFGWRFNGVHVSVNFDFGLHPEHFTFVAMRDFNHHDLDHRRLAPTEVTRIYNHTTIINNYVVNNRTVVNEGIKVDRVAAATHTQIHKVPIRDVPAGATPVTQTQATPVIYRPQLKAPPARPATMVAQKVDERHPVIQHAPIVTARVERAPNTTSKPGSVGCPAHQAQPPDNRNASRPMPNKPQDNAPRKPYPSTRNAPQPPAPNSTQLSQPPQQSHVPPRSGQEGKAASPRPARPAHDQGNPHQYYPKGYHQAAEIHSLPPLNPRPTAPPAQPDQSHKDDSGTKH